MKKRFVSLFLALLICFALIPFSMQTASADVSGTCGSNLSWKFNSSTGVLTITGSGAMYDHQYSSYWGWAKYRDQITTIKLPDKITNIGVGAFKDCTELVSITIPNSVTSIGEDAFWGCKGLTSIAIPDSVTRIEEDTFFDCKRIRSITIGDGVTYIGEDAFQFCESLQTVMLGKSVTEIDTGAFQYCYALRDVYYRGTRDMRNDIYIWRDNSYLNNATWHYAPTITKHPESQTVAAGESATLTVKVSESNVTYQWEYSRNNGATWVTWSGKTSDTANVKASATTNGYLYRCVVTNDGVSATSKSAKLTVSGVKPKITGQPKAATVASGKTKTFKVVAAGTDLKYQWYYSKNNGAKWTKYSGKTSASLKVKGTATTNGYLYRCKVTNSKGSVTSKSVKLTVSGIKPKIVVQPKAASVKSGKTAKFTVVAAGASLKYQWYYSNNNGYTWTKMSGKTAATLSVKGSNTNNGYLYHCVVKNSKGSVTTKNVKLTVK